MKTIYKYPFPIQDDVKIILPIDAVVLSIQQQSPHDQFLQLWALTNPTTPETKVYQFKVFGTGHPIPDNIMQTHKYVTTIITHNGRAVWHIFIEREYQEVFPHDSK